MYNLNFDPNLNKPLENQLQENLYKEHVKLTRFNVEPNNGIFDYNPASGTLKMLITNGETKTRTYVRKTLFFNLIKTLKHDHIWKNITFKYFF